MGSHNRMRLVLYAQLSQPESDSAIFISEELVMLEGDLSGRIFVQIAMWLVS
jgi:hypothetical protein